MYEIKNGPLCFIQHRLRSDQQLYADTDIDHAIDFLIWEVMLYGLSVFLGLR